MWVETVNCESSLPGLMYVSGFGTVAPKHMNPLAIINSKLVGMYTL